MPLTPHRLTNPPSSINPETEATPLHALGEGTGTDLSRLVDCVKLDYIWAPK
ncbi:hypothetical protein RHOER0001_0215 [Rhodococcus erythropolis SK121]|nr:hypothetical protein RHOER0001_0215 [Rhodococcus erythropolis SK121]